ncbi:MAG: hypothetical protein ROM54_00985 [Anaerobiospirillum sp.]|nr:hypothetical protein [Anaerobiospirillum sp.]
MAQMRVGAMALVLSLALLTGASAQAAQPKTFTVERSFSISHVQVPPICELDQFKTTCTRLVNYYVRRFEREMVSHINLNFNADDPFAAHAHMGLKREKSVQNVTMSAYSRPDEPVLTLFSIFKQKIVGQEAENLLVETINFDVKSGKSIRFNQLFENPELAAMLCARAIEAKYQSLRSPLLPVVISATELSPSNFIITPRGLRFFFAPGLVKPNSTTAESMLIRLEALQSAKPLSKWWSGKVDEITDEQRQALAQSSLSGVIKLEEDMPGASQVQEAQRLAQSQRNAQEAKEAAEQSAAAIEGKSVTDAVAAPHPGEAVAAQPPRR